MNFVLKEYNIDGGESYIDSYFLLPAKAYPDGLHISVDIYDTVMPYYDYESAKIWSIVFSMTDDKGDLVNRKIIFIVPPDLNENDGDFQNFKNDVLKSYK